MADLKSPVLTNLAAKPSVFNHPSMKGSLKEACSGKVDLSTDEDAADIIELVRVPSNCRVSEVLLSKTDHTSGAVDVGVYYYVGDTLTAIDVDFFASAAALGTAATHVDLTTESGVYTIEKQGQPLWQAVGRTKDDATEYVIAATVTTDVGGAGDIILKVRYVDNA